MKHPLLFALFWNDHSILRCRNESDSDKEGQFASEVIRVSGGEGVHVVYDGSGPVTYRASLDSLRRCGTFCWYGPVLGGPGPLDIMSLPRSIKIGYANFADHVFTPALIRTHSAQLFDWIARGVLKVRIGGSYPLAEASRAHADMESRTTAGKLPPSPPRACSPTS
jgi:NADPH:quinone reductase